MPTYDYECAKCGHEFELVQKMTDAPRKQCPKCRGKVQRKIGTGAGIIFKGSGFYITDYRSDDYQKKAKAETETAKGSSGSKDSGTAGSSGGAGTSKSSGSPESGGSGTGDKGTGQSASKGAAKETKSTGGENKPRTGSGGTKSAGS